MKQVYPITSENSSIHWLPINVDGQVVLDLGYGRWSIDVLEETSPMYFKKMGATRIIGVDYSHADYMYFNQNFDMSDGSKFLHMEIKSADDIRSLIKEHGITMIKTDIEGGEICMKDLTKEDLEPINEFAIEYHSKEIFEMFMAKLPEWGFTVYRQADFNGFCAGEMGVIFATKNRNNKVSLVCTTYRRFRCVERIIEQYLQQDYPNKELIIFNTDTENPMRLDPSMEGLNIKLINNSIDYETGQPYTNRGAICRDAVTHARGALFMLMDDDDIYLPWYVRQAVDGIVSNGKDAWKPEKSFFAAPGKLELTMNTLEASVIVRMGRIREIGFRQDVTGYEGLSWYTRLRDERELDEHFTNYIPAYCFNWSDPSDMAGHKQSGDINNPDNFENHKLRSGDISNLPLNRCGQNVIDSVYAKYYDYLLNHQGEFDAGLWTKYVQPHVNK